MSELKTQDEEFCISVRGLQRFFKNFEVKLLEKVIRHLLNLLSVSENSCRY